MDAREAAEELQQQARAALDGAGYFQLCDIQVEVLDDETLTLRGEVSTFHMKQLAQTVTRINGCRIQNLIDVINYPDANGESPCYRI